MSTHPNEMYTPAPYHAGRVDHNNRLGGLYDPYTVSYDISQPENGLLNQANLPVYHQIQAGTHLGNHTVPRFSRLLCEQPPHDGIRYGFPTGSENYGTAPTVVQGGVAPYNQAGSLQGNGPAINPSILGAVTPLGRQANITVEGSTHLRCGWTNCTARSTFNRWADLSRHIKTIHVFPASHVCEFCDQTFNRKDNLVEHQLRTHRFK